MSPLYDKYSVISNEVAKTNFSLPITIALTIINMSNYMWP